ncbi:MAG: hypothetical protein PSX37_05215 [bacterium]|nr:hypothetical protein [bacterium]
MQSLVIYGYSATATPMPIIDASLNLWSGLPNAVGSTIVFSSGGPGTVLSQWPISVFRIFSSSTTPLPPVPDFSRPIWAIEINSATTLAAGTYWLDVSFTCADASAPFFAIPLRPASGRTSAGWNALQRSPDGVWAAVADSGKPRGAADVPLDLAFQLLSGFSCPGDWDNSGSADSDDIIAFFSDWDRGEGDADGSGGTDSDDIIVFFASWETGC